MSACWVNSQLRRSPAKLLVHQKLEVVASFCYLGEMLSKLATPKHVKPPGMLHLHANLNADDDDDDEEEEEEEEEKECIIKDQFFYFSINILCFGYLMRWFFSENILCFGYSMRWFFLAPKTHV